MRKSSGAVGLMLVLLSGLAWGAALQTLDQRVAALEPVLDAYPPNVKSKAELASVKKEYFAIKKQLDAKLAKAPHDAHGLYLRGHLQSMGHNMDVQGAWEGATDDLRTLLKDDPANVPGLLALGQLWVNSKPELAPNAEKLFRAAQCVQGKQPLEEAQRGVYFALYYQGKMQDALRQAEYLHQTWADSEQYKSFEDMVRAVVQRTQGASAPEAAEQPVRMATCEE